MIGKPLKDTCKGCGKVKFLANKTRKLCASCVTTEKKEKKKEKKEFIKKKKQVSISSLVKKLDRVFSVFIRLRWAKSNGEVKCFTCEKKMHWRSSQCGHFMSRRYMSTRFDENNSRPQCYACNIALSGNQYIFGVNLDEQMGEGTAESMLILSRQQKKFMPSELEEMVKEFEGKVDSLRKKLQIWD
jgi:uncharacterized Zn finger protein (UPF0148 family)